ncbi:MAG: tetratricopeptide repeat protein [Phycisphaerae bacterium]
MSNSPRALAESAASVATASMSSGKPPEPAALAQARAALAAALAAAPTDLVVLFLAYQFHFRIGEFDAAELLAQRRLELAAAESADAARALGNLGLISQMRGDLDCAEQRMSCAVDIDRRIGDREGLARDLGNLALVPEARGDLARAEALTHEALEIARSIPGPRGEELVAGSISNLGDFARARGQIEMARELWVQAVTIFERLGVTKWKASFEKRFADLDRARS